MKCTAYTRVGVLRCKPSKGDPNSGILIPFGSSLVYHYKDVLTCCIIVKCKIRNIICYTVQLSDSGCENKMLCNVTHYKLTNNILFMNPHALSLYVSLLFLSLSSLALCLTICLSVSLSLCLSLSVSVCLCLSVSVFFFASLCLLVSPFVYVCMRAFGCVAIT